MSTPRAFSLTRNTNETQITLSLTLDGSGVSSVSTGVGFLDHMLDLFTKHSLFDLTVSAKGDLHVDPHHTVEDVGIAIGQAIDRSLGDKRGITRYGHFSLPMDETLANVSLDLSGRPFLAFNVSFPSPTIGAFPTELVQEFFQALSTNAKMNLHINVPYGINNHHIAEAIFKATARALRSAVSIDPRSANQIPSTKGSLNG